MSVTSFIFNYISSFISHNQVYKNCSLSFLYHQVFAIIMSLDRFVKQFFNKRSSDTLNINLVCPENFNLKLILDDLAAEIGASSSSSSIDQNLIIFEFNPSEKLELKFDHSIFAEGFTESIIRNIGQIYPHEFEVCGERCNNDTNIHILKIDLPPELYPRVQWFVYLFLDGMADKKIGRRWIK